MKTRGSGKKAHTGRARGRSSTAARLLLARRVQGASGVMMCGKHFTSIMFFFDEGAVLGATVRAQQGRFELKSSIKASLTLGQDTPKQCVLALSTEHPFEAAAPAASAESLFPLLEL